MSKGDILDGLLPSSSVELATEADPCSAMCAEVYDLIRTIRDPEKPQNLEELDVVRESDVRVEYLGSADWPLISIQFTPTVPHCSLATLIGLCIRVKLERNFATVYRYKLDICIKKGRHSTEDDINKQINDKERIAAALENPSLLELVESCIDQGDS